MTRKILIDARQPEETRVATINNNLLEDFEFEINSKKQLRGNIYLARVTRVEPSLQAAFVEYGGNRQGFLAFSEIHPDYYRIPVEDREKILKNVENNHFDEPNVSNNFSKDDTSENYETDEELIANEVKKVKINLYKNYKIQEVISKRQVLLVQVVKEERGNKGAALTTYISIAGRYCVLMPNTPKGGGVSRKIMNNSDRQRLKKVVDGLDVPKGMAVIIRTAGSKRTKVEIKRDYKSLQMIWEEVKIKTVESNAPDLIYEEGSILKRAIRDMYNSDFEEVLVEGEGAYKTCKDFMKSLMPSHTKKVQQYSNLNLPLFQQYTIDSQLADIFQPVVNLQSGGYLVINHTEALVAVDVNSGKATRERSIENTAFRTNLEAAEEFSKQAKLRDLSGLIVIDFIDMEDHKNRNNVEKKLKESLKQDRARIQVGEISSFGLLELSRQRLRPSVSEMSSETCEQCGGTGRVQSLEHGAMQVLRAAEEHVLPGGKEEITVKTNSDISLYILNNKIEQLKDIEERQKIKISFANDQNLFPPNVIIETLKEKKTVNESIKLEKNKNRKNKKGFNKDKQQKNKNVSLATLINEKNKNNTENGEDKESNFKKRTKKTKSKSSNNIEKSSINTPNDEKNPVSNQIEEKANNSIPNKKTSKGSRKKKSSKPIEIVDINKNENKDQPKKKGWWSN